MNILIFRALIHRLPAVELPKVVAVVLNVEVEVEPQRKTGRVLKVDLRTPKAGTEHGLATSLLLP